MKRLSVLVLGLGVVASCVSSPLYGEDKEDAKAAFEHLTAEKRFSISSSIGGGEIPGDNGFFPVEVGCFLTLLKSAKGKDYGKELVENAQPAGQLYGLCLLYHLDKDAFKKGCADLKRSDKSARHLRGDISMIYKVSNIVHADDPATIILKKNQTFEDWFEKNKAKWQALGDWTGNHKYLTKFHKLKFVPIDIRGGAIPKIVAGLKKPARRKAGPTPE